MKLDLVTETFPPEINGVAMTLGQLSAGLARRGFAVTVHRPRQPSDRDRARSGVLAPPRAASPSGGPAFREVLHAGVPIPGYAMLRLGFPARAALIRAWRAERPDVVHVATEGPLGWSALSAADALGIPLASSFHTNFHSYSRHYGFAFLTRPALAYLRWFHNRTRITLSPTTELNAELTRDGFRGMRLLSRGVDTELFSPAKRDFSLRAHWGAGPDDPVFIHVSRLAAEKNFSLLFRAWSEIRAAHPRARFVVVSDGPLRKKLSRDYPWAHFTGFLEREDLARYYASADVFLYPSLTETFGNVVTESMASGLAVGAFKYAAAARFLRDGENGLLAPFGKEAEFLALASRLGADLRLRRSLGAVARATAEDIPWSRVIDGFARDLAEVAGSVRSGGDPQFAASRLAPDRA
ncbi:MAG: glycosyltransferase family 1 protein [Verrucomicrobia bacterium]|nr:MAG: glycosyltransferase family 1 protein [Verrucomicrobiota bacterium]